MHNLECDIFQQTIKELLTNNEVIFPLANVSLIKISGENSPSFLQGQFTCDVTKINEQASSLGALCNQQGRVLAVFTLFKKGNDYFCLLPSDISNQFITHLSKYAVFSKVILEDVTESYFLHGFIGEHETSIYNKNKDVLIFYPQFGMLPHSFILSTDTYFVHAKDTSSEDINQTYNLAWKLIKIFSGYANVYSQTLGTVTPHMLDLHLQEAVSFNKGCYVGQEIIARTHYLGKSKRHLYLAEISTNLDVAPGELIYSDGQEVGVVMESAVLKMRTYLLVVLQDPIDREFLVKAEKLLKVSRFVPQPRHPSQHGV